ncbi:MAG: hypothetical protein ACREID_05140 [Planctomycetota bacterium]
MPARAAALVVLLCLSSCARGRPYDPGHRIHVILAARRPPAAPIDTRPVCAVGHFVERAPPRALTAEGVEVAVFHVPTGRHRFSIWEPSTRAHGRRELDVRHELWVVLEVDPETRASRLGLFEEPPHAEIGRWRPLAAFPE